MQEEKENYLKITCKKDDVCYNEIMKKMYETVNEEIEKAVVFCPIDKGADKDFQFAEIRRLCESANLEVAEIFYQDIKALNRRTIIGTGKLEEIKSFVKENGIDVLVVDFKLTGSQLKNLSDELGVKVLDRILLIIDIFACNAKSNEGKIEVKLAQNKYLLTRLSSMQGSQGRFGGAGVGMRGPGETKLELDRRKLEAEILTLKKEIEKIKNARAVNRNARIKAGIKSVVIGGYTNAGKSSLFNLLTRDEIYVQDKLFATLETTSRRMFLGEYKYCILTDTVGFISKLPHELVESFASTLEEIKDADLILHVVDVSDKNYKRNIEITNEILDDIHATKKRIIVLNKTDLLSGPIEVRENEIPFSVKKKYNLEKLKELIKKSLED